MADIVSSAVRSRMMSGIQASDTKSEILVRKASHAQGYRLRLYRKDLPVKRDIVLPKFRAFSQFDDILNMALNRLPRAMNAHHEELLPSLEGTEVAALTESFAKVLRKEYAERGF